MSDSQFKKQYRNCSAPALAEKTYAGFLLKKPPIETSIFANIFALIIILWVIPTIIVTMACLLFIFLVEINELLAFVILVTSIFLIIYFILSRIFNYFRYLKLLPEQLILSEYPLKLGGEYSFTFLRQIKNNKILNQPGKFKFIIACVEIVKYTRGTDTEIEIHTIYESQVKEQFVSQGVNALKMKQYFQIPSNLPPSFEGKNNQIRWILLIYQDFPELPKNIYYNFTLVVDPIISL